MTTLSFREKNPDATLGYTGHIVSPEHPLPVTVVAEGGLPVDGGGMTPTGPVEVPEGLETTGTPSGTTYLNGVGAWATPPNTTYTALSTAEAATGTATTVRGVSALLLKTIIEQRVATIIPTPPAVGTFNLQAVDGVMSWVAVTP